ncbi:glycoside hydrolase family 88 protein [Halalkalibacter urbisdiaboli]|uniref:glycoside hydrolase family 88 protein n=1 Tax=Halalkalibacter urbisdiaboli TaxID=1960589 RepID=UPI000B44AEBC|nr:glycoside hydrolase family 88 protein [Halalkalibacter urbisdiaboli]
MSTFKEDVVLNKLATKVERMIEQIGDKSPHVAGNDGVYDDMPHEWWTSSFWPGILWVMYDMNGNEKFKDAAMDWDEKLEKCFRQHPVKVDHDVGFQFLLTAVIKNEILDNEESLRIGLEAANYLAGRLNPAGGYIKAWNHDKTGWAIIDCMMNISLLFWASRVTGDPRYKHIAQIHADTTLQYGIRDDGSTSHILSFNPDTGEFIESVGGQGNAGDSAWSRGNAWALYGFANTYKHTGEVRYLNAAKRVAHHFIAALPEDYVPHWDFRLEQKENEPRDSSAGAIAASGLLEIADAVPANESGMYRVAALNILNSLTENYGTWEQPEHQGILLHGTSHKPADANVDVSLIYGDYYYVEAIAKLNGWKRRIF